MRDVRLFLEGRHKDLAQELRARVEAASAAMRYEEASALHELLAHRGGDGRKAEDGRGRGQRHRHSGLLRRAAAGRGELVPPAPRPHRRPAGVLLGGPAGIRCAGVFRFSAEADLSERALHSGLHSRAGRIRRLRAAGGDSQRDAAGARWRFTRRSAGRRRPCWRWWNRTRSTASSSVSAC